MPYNSQLKYTTAKYYLPSGRCIQEVNYSNIEIPDSLEIKYYTTSNGRDVLAGKGISPDIIVKDEILLNPFLTLMYTDWMIFDFATDFRIKNPNFSLLH